ncbi:MAG: hypothetical protein ACYC69_01445 [Thermodesulfovibrionales bacterium]
MQPKRTFHIRQLFIFSAVAFLIVAVLGLLNWLPSLMQRQRLKHYSSIDTMKKELRIKTVFLPTFLPEELDLTWPPTELYAQDTPFPAVMMHFTRKGTSEIRLIIHQVDSKAPYDFKPRIKIRSRHAASLMTLKHRQAHLTPAVCDNDIPCNQLTWNENGTAITLVGTFPARDLIRIAASMLPGD